MLMLGKKDPSIIVTDHNDGGTLKIFVQNCRTKLTYRKRSRMIYFLASRDFLCLSPCLCPLGFYYYYFSFLIQVKDI